MATQNNELLNIIGCLQQEKCTAWIFWEKPELFDVDPRDYLEFAKQDLVEGGDRGLINGLTNAKRAMTCRIDAILKLYNLECASNHNYPTKLGLLKYFGLSAPDIVPEQIMKRNQIEHEYTKPKNRECKDAIDIVELFLKASDQYVEKGHISGAHVECPIDVQEEMDNKAKKRIKTIKDVYDLNFNSEERSLQVSHKMVEHNTIIGTHGQLWEPREQILDQYENTDFCIGDKNMVHVKELIRLLLKKDRDKSL